MQSAFIEIGLERAAFLHVADIWEHRRGTANGGHGLAKGAAVFALNILTNANGNDQGMPAALPQVTGCANTFGSSTAPDAGTGNRDNVDVFGADRLGLTLACGDRVFTDGFDPP